MGKIERIKKRFPKGKYSPNVLSEEVFFGMSKNIEKAMIMLRKEVFNNAIEHGENPQQAENTADSYFFYMEWGYQEDSPKVIRATNEGLDLLKREGGLALKANPIPDAEDNEIAVHWMRQFVTGHTNKIKKLVDTLGKKVIAEMVEAGMDEEEATANYEKFLFGQRKTAAGHDALHATEDGQRMAYNDPLFVNRVRDEYRQSLIEEMPRSR